MNLSDRVAQLKEEIRKIKTEQYSQNDSYGFYAYQSSNLWGQYWDTISVEFVPYSRQPKDVVVNFECAGGNIVQFNETVDQTSTNPLKGTVRTQAHRASGGQSDFWHGGQGQEFPDWAKYFYITCYSNCRGELRITLNGSG